MLLLPEYPAADMTNAESASVPQDGNLTIRYETNLRTPGRGTPKPYGFLHISSFSDAGMASLDAFRYRHFADVSAAGHEELYPYGGHRRYFNRSGFSGMAYEDAGADKGLFAFNTP